MITWGAMTIRAILVLMALAPYALANSPRPTTLPIPNLGKSAITCATFSKSGAGAIAWLQGQNFSLRLLQRDQKRSTLIFHVRIMTRAGSEWPSCRLAFSADSKLLAAGVSDKATLHLLIFDVRQRSLAYRLEIDKRIGASPPFSLLGFLDDTRELALWSGAKVLNLPGAVAYADVTTLIIHPEISGSSKVIIYRRRVTGRGEPPGWSDVAHNRLWYPNDPHFCPLSSVALSGPPVPGPKVEKSETLGSAACDDSEYLLYPRLDQLIGIASRDSGGKLYDIKLGKHSRVLAILNLPHVKVPHWAEIDSAVLSPDGRAATIMREIQSHGLFDNGRSWNDLAVIQIRPLMVLAHLRPPRHHRYLRRVAIGDRGAKVVLFACWDGTWMRYTIPLSTRTPE